MSASEKGSVLLWEMRHYCLQVTFHDSIGDAAEDAAYNSVYGETSYIGIEADGGWVSKETVGPLMRAAEDRLLSDDEPTPTRSITHVVRLTAPIGAQGRHEVGVAWIHEGDDPEPVLSEWEARFPGRIRLDKR